MNRKSKTLVLAGALFLLLTVKYALGQIDNDVVGWDPTYDDPSEWIFSMMTAAPILGAVIGAIRVFAQRSARPIVEPICLR